MFALVFWLCRLPLGAAGCARRTLVCPVLLALWFAVDYEQFAHLRLLQRLEQSRSAPEQLGTPDGMLEAQSALVRALLTPTGARGCVRSQRSYRIWWIYTISARQIKTPLAAMRLLLQDAETDEQRALLEQLQSIEDQYVEVGARLPAARGARRRTMSSATTCWTISSGRRCASFCVQFHPPEELRLEYARS